MTGFHATIYEDYLGLAISDVLFFLIDIFYPMGELISLHRLRCSPFAVVHYSFMGHCLAAAATSTREQYKFKNVDDDNT